MAENRVLEAWETSPSATVLARLYGQPFVGCPDGLFIPPEAMRVFLESFEGPLDLLLYLIRKQKFDIMDIPMKELTEQYMAYVDLIREHELELAAAYLVMSATLMQIKSRLLLPRPTEDGDDEPEDPRQALMERLMVYEQMRDAAQVLEAHPRQDRDFVVAKAEPLSPAVIYPDLAPEALFEAWVEVLGRMKLQEAHKVTRESLSVREHMMQVLDRLNTEPRFTLTDLCREEPTREKLTVWLLALLELAKTGDVQLTQTEPYAPIYVTAPASSLWASGVETVTLEESTESVYDESVDEPGLVENLEDESLGPTGLA